MLDAGLRIGNGVPSTARNAFPGKRSSNFGGWLLYHCNISARFLGMRMEFLMSGYNLLATSAMPLETVPLLYLTSSAMRPIVKPAYTYIKNHTPFSNNEAQSTLCADAGIVREVTPS